ncbi:MAG: RidA family protein [Bacteroidetes bacterium]|nr:RidA family protein [Bacteroidota bacterium]MBX7130624.1 Rid family detoxifying hydrolase [Flavobacteriales bacterium]MCC6656499.1 RidA family protein [Flavobacteriales bacterium]HMU14268.1 Rid family detoxifying hydrolase [Flavobacteriales bacterium]HMZ48940.1 Rid family detoxifying hydrolase [Flavobacteriales bacterium]
MKRSIRPANSKTEGTPYTPAVEANGFIFVSGQIASVEGTRQLRTESITQETEAVMENIGKILEAAGLGMDDIVKCTIYVRNLQFYAEVSRVYLTYFKGDPPARETFAVADIPRGVNVMISAIAARG